MIILFCGAPGAGKTAVADKLIPKLKKIGRVKIFSSDALKPPVYKKFLALLLENQSKYDFLLFDATFYKKSHRDDLISRAGDEKVVTAFFDVSLETALRRNKQRKAQIPVEGVRAIFSQMEKPVHPDIYIDTEKISANEAVDKIFQYLTRKKRIFIALPISQELQKIILKWEKNYKNLPVRWLSPKNLHITLVPPWYESDIKKNSSQLECIKSPFFDVVFESIEFGPDPKRPRLIWAKGKAPEALLALQKNVTKLTRQKSERRPFKLHLTLARFRPENFAKFPVKKLNEKVTWREKITSFMLMESLLSPKGAEYKILEKYEFKN